MYRLATKHSEKRNATKRVENTSGPSCTVCERSWDGSAV